jgi:hypothetical protein
VWCFNSALGTRSSLSPQIAPSNAIGDGGPVWVHAAKGGAHICDYPQLRN